VVAQSRLEEDPRLKEMWAGYAFAADFREERGHAYMLVDQQLTGRQRVVKQPGACLNCHGSMVVPWMKAGDGDLVKGFEKLNPLPYDSAAKDVAHPISCIDCHDPETMALRITRPAFMEGIKAYKASQGIPDYDVTTMATRQEMRSFVCGQCHVEYYFKGAEKRLTFPWERGLRADSMVAYYEANGHKDWTHKRTGAAALKVQHPEFEMWSSGLHARSGVACADCHMPYVREGAVKVSDHWLRSPLVNINAACQTCHKQDEQALKDRIAIIQNNTAELLRKAETAIVDAIDAINAAKAAGATAEQLKDALQLQRKATFYWDFVAAENSTGFHSPQEAARVLANSIDAARQAQLAAQKLAK
jgi:nitrite reductase (cytochrome c-552)